MARFGGSHKRSNNWISRDGDNFSGQGLAESDKFSYDGSNVNVLFRLVSVAHRLKWSICGFKYIDTV